MPLFDYICPVHRIPRIDVYQVRHADPPPLCEDYLCGLTMERMPSAPSLISILGYSEFNGYSRGVLDVQKHGSITTTIETR